MGGLIVCREGYHKFSSSKRTFVDLYDPREQTLTTLFVHTGYIDICAAAVDETKTLLAFTVASQKHSRPIHTSSTSSAGGRGESLDISTNTNPSARKGKLTYTSFLVQLQAGQAMKPRELRLTSYSPQLIQFLPRVSSGSRTSRKVSFLFFYRRSIDIYYVSLGGKTYMAQHNTYIAKNYIWYHWDQQHGHLYVIVRKLLRAGSKEPGNGGGQNGSGFDLPSPRWHLFPGASPADRDEAGETAVLLRCYHVVAEKHELVYEIPLSMRLWDVKELKGFCSGLIHGRVPGSNPGAGASFNPSASLYTDGEGSDGRGDIMDSGSEFGGGKRSFTLPDTRHRDDFKWSSSTGGAAEEKGMPLSRLLGQQATNDSMDVAFPEGAGRMAYRRVSSPDNYLLHLVELSDGGVCLCQQHLPNSKHGLEICVTIYLLVHRARVDLRIPLHNNTDAEVRHSRVYFDSLCDMLVVYLPGVFLHFLDCSISHRPMLGCTVQGFEMATPLPQQQRGLAHTTVLRPFIGASSQAWGGAEKGQHGHKGTDLRGHVLLDCTTGIAYEYTLNRECLLSVFQHPPSPLHQQVVHLALVHMQDAEFVNESMMRVCQSWPMHLSVPLMREYVVAAAYAALREAGASPQVLAHLRITSMLELHADICCEDAVGLQAATNCGKHKVHLPVRYDAGGEQYDWVYTPLLAHTVQRSAVPCTASLATATMVGGSSSSSSQSKSSFSFSSFSSFAYISANTATREMFVFRTSKDAANSKKGADIIPVPVGVTVI
mgnify:CR=1 FL=1